MASPTDLNPTPTPLSRVLAWPPQFTLAQTGLLLALALFAGFGPVLLGQKSFFYRDYGVMGYPTMVFLKEALISGQFPLWNPYSNMGAPYLAQWGTMVCYPLGYPFLFLPQPWGLNLFCLAHLWWGGLGAFVLCRRLVFSRWPSAMAAFIFLFSGVTLASLTWPNYTVALGWLPWLAAWSLDFLRKGGRIRLSKAALAGGLQFMSGAPEIILMTWILAGSLALIFRPRVSALPRLLGRGALLGLVVACLSAIQLLPFLELLSLSQRSAASGTGQWSLPGYGWANFLLPMFHAFQTPEGTHFQYGQEFLSSTYLGGTQLFLAAAACLAVRWVRPLGLLAILLAILALGPEGWIWTQLKTAFPPTGMIRYPVKYLLLLPALAALASAAALAWLTRNPSRVRAHLRVGLGSLLALILLLSAFQRLYPYPFDYWPAFLRNSSARVAIQLALLGLILAGVASKLSATQAWLRFAALALVACDGLTHLPNQNPTIRANVLTGAILTNAFPETAFPNLGEGRAFITPAVERKLLHSDQKNPSLDFTGKRLALWSHLNLLEAVPKVNGSSTLQLRWQKEVEDMIYKKGQSSPGLMRLLGVAIASSPENALDWVSIAGASSLYFTPISAAPMDSPGAVERLAGAFDPSATLLLDPKDIPLAESHLGKNSSMGIQVELVSWSLNEVRFKLSSEAPFALMVSQSWHPAWIARADGRKVPLLKANHAFQAALIPAGAKEVRLTYENNAFRLGCALSAATLLSLLFPWIRGIGRRN